MIEARVGQPRGSGRAQLAGRSLPGILHRAATGPQTCGRDSAEARGDRRDGRAREGPYVQMWSETPSGCGRGSLVGTAEEIGKQVIRRRRSKAGEQRPQENRAKKPLDTQHVMYADPHIRTGGRSWWYQPMSS